jgi:hypothetical protein
VFTKEPSAWHQVAELVGSDDADGTCGLSVAVSGSIVVVGAVGHANDAGRAYSGLTLSSKEA